MGREKDSPDVTPFTSAGSQSGPRPSRSRQDRRRFHMRLVSIGLLFALAGVGACTGIETDPEPCDNCAAEPDVSPDVSPAVEPDAAPEVAPPQPGDATLSNCEHSKDICGASYYDTAQDCYDAGVDYWGTCSETLAALDAFSECMEAVPCEDYDPDSYNPANTPCSELWSALRSAGRC